MRRQDSPPAELLEQHRRDIETLDRRVLHLVRERLDLARQIGDLKRSCGVPLRNFPIQALNPITEEVADGLMRAVREWREAVVTGDSDGFASLMQECRDYLTGNADGAAGAGR